MEKAIKLLARVFITFNIEALTGLHIGGSDTQIEIGGVDKTVIRDPISNRPYIPGSSLRGKMRSLLEKYHGKRHNQQIGQGFIHTCSSKEDFLNCEICQVFGVPGEKEFATPTRLVVRDIHLSNASASKLNESGRTDLPYTEVKTEVSIDRVTSAANPRQMERVPAGVVFGSSAEGEQPGEMVFNIYQGDRCDPKADIEHLTTVLEGMALLQDDYLGGLGSRGSGKVCFTDLAVHLRLQGEYLKPKELIAQKHNLEELISGINEIQAKLRSELKIQ